MTYPFVSSNNKPFACNRFAIPNAFDKAVAYDGVGVLSNNGICHCL